MIGRDGFCMVCGDAGGGACQRFIGSEFSYTVHACPSAGAVHACTNICHAGETICVFFIDVSFVSVSMFAWV